MKYFINRTEKQLNRDMGVYGASFAMTRHRFNPLRFIFGKKRRIHPLKVYLTPQNRRRQWK